jgi:hypothetical protein
MPSTDQHRCRRVEGLTFYHEYDVPRRSGMLK